MQGGRYAEAVESVTRYLTDAGREGTHYRAALELLLDLDACHTVINLYGVEVGPVELKTEKKRRVDDAIQSTTVSFSG